MTNKHRIQVPESDTLKPQCPECHHHSLIEVLVRYVDENNRGELREEMECIHRGCNYVRPKATHFRHNPGKFNR